MERFLRAATAAVTISESVLLRRGTRAVIPPPVTINCWLAPREGGGREGGGRGGGGEGGEGGGRREGGREEGGGEEGG